MLSGLIVGLNCWQFISELLATVELPDFGEVNLGKPVLHLRVVFIGDHSVPLALLVKVDCEDFISSGCTEGHPFVVG